MLVCVGVAENYRRGDAGRRTKDERQEAMAIGSKETKTKAITKRKTEAETETETETDSHQTNTRERQTRCRGLTVRIESQNHLRIGLTSY